MTTKGRKPKPTILRLVGGNAGKRPLNKREPKVPAYLSSAPAHLNKDAKREWRRLANDLYRVGLLTKIDRAVLAAYCQAYGRWCQAERELALPHEEGGGLTIETSNGNWVQNPLVGIANKAAGDMARFAVEFGMTPSARTRIETEAPIDSPDAPTSDKYF